MSDPSSPRGAFGRFAPYVLLLGWVILAGWGTWSAARSSIDPPAMDAMTYAQKASAFWAAVDKGEWFNPLDLPPTVRPPGTILMSYPFGFTTDFAGFYFRSSFLPLALLALAVVLAHSTPAPTRERWAVAALGVALASLPVCFQFQLTRLPSAVFWGLTDGFIAGVAGLAMAAVVRSVDRRSAAWAAVAALLASFTLLIKPAGLLVMAAAGLSWLILAGTAIDWRRTRGDFGHARFAVVGLAAASGIFAATLWAALTSDYFSPENTEFGAIALAQMRREYTFITNFNPDLFIFMVKITLGFVVCGLTVLGLVAAIWRPVMRRYAAAAAVCLLIGLWFWLVQTGMELSRHVLPFAAMTVVALVPPLSAFFAWLYAPARALALLAIAAPGLVSTALLFTPDPPTRWQEALGISIAANAYDAENRQALEFLKTVQGSGAPQATLFFFDIFPALLKVYGVIDYANTFMGQTPRVTVLQPRSWQTHSVYKFDTMIGADYIAFETMDETELNRRLALPGAADFNAENVLLSAWFQTLKPEDGISIVSDTRVRILKVENREVLRTKLHALKAGYTFSPEFNEANPTP